VIENNSTRVALFVIETGQINNTSSASFSVAFHCALEASHPHVSRDWWDPISTTEFGIFGFSRLVSVQQLVNSRRFVRRYQGEEISASSNRSFLNFTKYLGTLENHSRRSKQNLSTLQRMAEESVWRQWEQVCCEILQGKLAFFPLNESLWELVSYQVLRPKTKSDPSATTDSGCSMENTVSTEKHKRSSTCSEPMDLERQENSSEKLMNALTISPTSPMSFSLLQYSENENHYSLRQKELVGEFYSVDELLTYEPFCADFGPLNLGQL